MRLGDGLGHRTSPTLVHPGDTWEQLRASLSRNVPAVKLRFRPDKRSAFRCACRATRPTGEMTEHVARELVWVKSQLA